MKKNLVQNFYKNLIYNLKNSKNLFYKNNDLEFSYKYVYEKITILTSIIGKHKKQSIMVLSDKSIGYYISVISILLTGNTWIQISPNIPDERIIQISKISGAKIIIYDDSFKKTQQKIQKSKNIFA